MTPTRSWQGLVFIATSTHGHIAQPDGDISWLADSPYNPGSCAEPPWGPPPPDYATLMQRVDHLVMGRGT